MQDRTAILEPLIERVEEYGKTRFELLKFKALDKITDSLSIFVSRSFVLLSIFVFIFFVNIGLALWIGEVLGKSWYGFFCVAGFYAVLGFVLYFSAHRWVKKRVSDTIVSQILN